MVVRYYLTSAVVCTPVKEKFTCSFKEKTIPGIKKILTTDTRAEITPTELRFIPEIPEKDLLLSHIKGRKKIWERNRWLRPKWVTINTLNIMGMR